MTRVPFAVSCVRFNETTFITTGHVNNYQ